MKTAATTLLVIGGGPGGYVAAIRAAQRGVPTTLVEAEALGGVCLNVGCIPSKAMIHAADEFHRAVQFASAAGSPLGIRAAPPQLDLAQMLRWKSGIVRRLTGGVAGLLKRAGVNVVTGWATIVDGKTVDVQAAGGPQRVTCEHLLLATGSVPVELPDLPFGGPVIGSTEALAPAALPERLVVVGAGYIGLELGTVYRKLGVQVAVVEALPKVLPGWDDELTRPVEAALRSLGVELHLGCRVQGMNGEATALRVEGADHAQFELACDRVLVAAGRRPRISGFGLEHLQLDSDGEAVRIDAQCRTSMTGVWAIGDLTGEPMLAHRAFAQAEVAADAIAGGRRRFEPAAIPAVCYTDPEIVSVGLDPASAEKSGVQVLTSAYPLAANGRAMTIESTAGFVRVVAQSDNHRILGWQAVGRGVSELAAAFALSIEMGARLEDVAMTIHAHPTLGEAMQEAALRALGQALHV